MDKNQLKNEITIIESSGSQCLPFWKGMCDSLRLDIINKDPEQFLQFNAVQQTMFVGNTEYCVEEYKELMNTDLAQYLPDHNKFTAGLQSNIDDTTTGNTIHHLYHIYQLIKYYQIVIPNMSHIIEIGGGYGNMARLFYMMGFRGKYQIVDLPEFCLLQQYYLDSLDVKNVIWSHNVENIYDIAIATWSLSEMPTEERKKFIKIQTKYWLIAYGESFEKINNLLWFNEFSNTLSRIKWMQYQYPYLNKQYYLLGKNV